MTARSPVPQRTTAAPRRAADPTTSAWVAANAGSGKTYVFEMLMEAGMRRVAVGVRVADPSSLTCIS